MNAETKVRQAMVRDARGRDLFVPWYPFSRAAYVLPSPSERAAVSKRTRIYVVFWLAAIVAVQVVRSYFGLPIWYGWVVVVLAAMDWAWWTRRYTRGLERTRYEKPAS